MTTTKKKTTTRKKVTKPTNQICLTPTLITLLSNFASINSNLYVEAGSNLKTISPEKNFFASVDVDEKFPVEFGLWDLPEFLGVASMYGDNANVFFGDNTARIGTDADSPDVTHYAFSPKALLTVPTTDIKMPKTDVEIDITEEQFNLIRKTSSILKVNNLSFVGDTKNLSMVIGDKKDPNGKRRVINIGKSAGGKFTAHFNIDYMKMLPGAYSISISSKGISEWKHQTPKDKAYKNLTYWLSLDSDSKF